MDYSWQDLRPGYGLYDDPCSQKWGNNQDFQWDYNEAGTISDEEKLVNLISEYLQKNEETMSTQQRASQNMQEECYYNQECIDSYQLDEGSREGFIGEFMQSNHQDKQDIQVLQQANTENLEIYMWENDRQSNEMNASIHRIES